MNAAAAPLVLTTRPSGQGKNLRRRLRALGWRAANLPAVRLADVDDVPSAQRALCQALGAERVVFTSPAAVRHALALQPGLRPRGTCLAVGPGTARALHEAGWGPVVVPQRADSEGLLALPALQAVDGVAVAIVGAAGGRRLLGNRLTQAGAAVLRAHVYQRLPARLDRRHLALLESLDKGDRITITSAQTLQALHERLPQPLWRKLRAATVVVSSARLQARARQLGFSRIQRASSAADADLLQAIGPCCGG